MTTPTTIPNLKISKATPNKAEPTREGLLLAAASLFAEEGIERASMAAVAAKARCSRGALYSHFGSKQDLVREVARSVLQVTPPKEEPQPSQNDDLILPGITDGTIDLESLTAWLSLVLKNAQILLSLELMAYGIRHPEMREELSDMLITAHSLLAVQVKQLRLSRLPGPRSWLRDLEPPDIDDTDTATAIISVINNAAFRTKLSKHAQTTHESSARIIARILASNDRNE